MRFSFYNGEEINTALAHAMMGTCFHSGPQRTYIFGVRPINIIRVFVFTADTQQFQDD